MTAAQDGRDGDVRSATQVLEVLRDDPENIHLLGGYGPLVVGVILLALMVLLAPTVAPERVVERPVSSSSAADSEGS